MATPPVRPPFPPLFAVGPNDTSVTNWALLIRHYEGACKYLIITIVFYKCTSGKEHEFILVRYRHESDTDPGKRGWLLTDRSPEEKFASSSGKEQGSKNSLVGVSPIRAKDGVIVADSDSDSGLLFRFQPYRKLGEVSFEDSQADLESVPRRPSVLDLSLIMVAADELCPMYDILRSQCYWYAGTVWSALVNRFSGSTPDMMKEQGTYKGVTIPGKLDGNGVEDVLERYDQLRGVYDDEMAKQQTEAERKRHAVAKDEFQRGLEEGKREREQLLEEVLALRQQLAERDHHVVS